MEKLDWDDNHFEQLVETFYETNKEGKLSTETDNSPKKNPSDNHFLEWQSQIDDPRFAQLTHDEQLLLFYSDKAKESFNVKTTINKKRTGRKPQIILETSSNGELQCPHCPKTAKERYLLTKHIYKNHGKGAEKIECPQCNKLLSRKNLSNHIKSQH